MNQQEQALDYLTKTRFDVFMQRAFMDLNPDTEYLHNWHLDYICWLLTQTMAKPPNLTPEQQDKHTQLRRLIINIPPRTLKSFTVSSAFPAFVLGHHPHEKLIGASYSSSVARKLHEDTARIMALPWYQRLFPNTQIARSNQKEIETSRGGQRFTTSVGGSVTGMGGNFLLADDLLNPQEAASDTERETANEFFSVTLSSRLNNRQKGVIIVIMQRLHEDDLTGHLIAKNRKLPESKRWHTAIIPAKNTSPNTLTYTYGNRTYHYRPNDLLHEDRLPQSELDALRVDLGTYAYTGQYQQAPAPAGGGIVKLKWYGRYDPEYPPHTSQIELLALSIDTSFKVEEKNDFSSLQLWAKVGPPKSSEHRASPPGYYLLHTSRVKLEYPQLKAKIPQLYHTLPQRFPNYPTISAILLEDKASGQSLIQDYRNDPTNVLPIIAITPHKDKTTRFESCSPLIEAGHVYLPQVTEDNAKWMGPVEDEILQFPKGKHDDTIDTQSQALNWFKQRDSSQFRIRSV